MFSLKMGNDKKVLNLVCIVEGMLKDELWRPNALCFFLNDFKSLSYQEDG